MQPQLEQPSGGCGNGQEGKVTLASLEYAGATAQFPVIFLVMVCNGNTGTAGKEKVHPFEEADIETWQEDGQLSERVSE